MAGIAVPTEPTLPGDVKRAVTRDGHRPPYHGDKFAKIHSGKVRDALVAAGELRGLTDRPTRRLLSSDRKCTCRANRLNEAKIG
jgi:hypothetical protein